MYSDVLTGIVCDTVSIPASLCVGGVCNHVFKVSSSSCIASADISVTILADNTLGEAQVGAVSIGQ